MLRERQKYVTHSIRARYHLSSVIGPVVLSFPFSCLFSPPFTSRFFHLNVWPLLDVVLKSILRNNKTPWFPPTLALQLYKRRNNSLTSNFQPPITHVVLPHVHLVSSGLFGASSSPTPRPPCFPLCDLYRDFPHSQRFTTSCCYHFPRLYTCATSGTFQPVMLELGPKVRSM